MKGAAKLAEEELGPEPATKLQIESQAYQVLLEGHRLDPDDEELYQDMLKAKAAMEVAWLEHKHARPPPR